MLFDIKNADDTQDNDRLPSFTPRESSVRSRHRPMLVGKGVTSQNSSPAKAPDSIPDAKYFSPPRRRGRPPMSKEPYLVDEKTGCWVWQRAKNHRGYGLCYDGEKMLAAHRHFYMIHKGHIPDGMQLDHLCRNRACVNPDHLEVVTGKENNHRGNSTKLDDEMVAEMRFAKAIGASNPELAARFGITRDHVSRVCNGHRWCEPKGAA